MKKIYNIKLHLKSNLVAKWQDIIFALYLSSSNNGNNLQELYSCHAETFVTGYKILIWNKH
jgi:hypothetical protein